jgi:hypothetical protein
LTVETAIALETQPPPSGEGTVVLDIGGDRGAAVIFIPAALEGSEIEIRPAGEPWTGTHTGIRRREVHDGVRFAAVFGNLPAGPYQLRVKGTEADPVLAIGVTGGAVTEVGWPTGC